MKQESHITLLLNFAIGNVGLLMMRCSSVAIAEDWVGHKIYAEKNIPRLAM